VVFKKVKYLI